MRSFHLNNTCLNFATPRNLSYKIDENKKSLPTIVNLKLNFITKYSLSFWSYSAFFGFLETKYIFFHQYSTLLRGFKNHFQKRFDDDIFFTKIKVAKMIIFRKKNKKHVKFCTWCRCLFSNYSLFPNSEMIISFSKKLKSYIFF